MHNNIHIKFQPENLTYFLNPYYQGPPEISGYFRKIKSKKSGIRNYNKRYFTFNLETLDICYTETSSFKPEDRKFISLNDVKYFTDKSESNEQELFGSPYSYAIVIHTEYKAEKQQIELRCKALSQQEQWLHALKYIINKKDFLPILKQENSFNGFFRQEFDEYLKQLIKHTDEFQEKFNNKFEQKVQKLTLSKQASQSHLENQKSYPTSGKKENENENETDQDLVQKIEQENKQLEEENQRLKEKILEKKIKKMEKQKKELELKCNQQLIKFDSETDKQQKNTKKQEEEEFKETQQKPKLIESDSDDSDKVQSRPLPKQTEQQNNSQKENLKSQIQIQKQIEQENKALEIDEVEDLENLEQDIYSKKQKTYQENLNLEEKIAENQKNLEQIKLEKQQNDFSLSNDLEINTIERKRTQRGNHKKNASNINLTHKQEQINKFQNIWDDNEQINDNNIQSIQNDQNQNKFEDDSQKQQNQLLSQLLNSNSEQPQAADDNQEKKPQSKYENKYQKKSMSQRLKNKEEQFAQRITKIDKQNSLLFSQDQNLQGNQENEQVIKNNDNDQDGHIQF